MSTHVVVADPQYTWWNRPPEPQASYHTGIPRGRAMVGVAASLAGGGSGSDTVHLQVYSLETSYYYRLRSAQWLTNHTSLSTIDSFGDPLLGIAGLAGYGSAEYNMPAATGSPSGVWSGTTVYQRAWTWDREQMPLSMIGEGGTPTVTCDQQLGTAPGGTIGIRALFEFDVFDITQGLDWHAQVEHIT